MQIEPLTIDTQAATVSEPGNRENTRGDGVMNTVGKDDNNSIILHVGIHVSKVFSWGGGGGGGLVYMRDTGVGVGGGDGWVND